MPICKYCSNEIKNATGTVRGKTRRYKCPHCRRNPSYPLLNDSVIEKTEEVKKVEQESVSIKGNEITSDKIIEIVYAERKKPDALLLAHGFEPDTWTLLTATNNFWHAQRPADAGQLVMGQSKITCRPKQADDVTLEQIDSLLSGLKRIEHPVLPEIEDRKKENRWLEITVADLHIGDEGTDETVELFLESIQRIAEKIRGTGIRVCFAQMGDLAAYDTLGRTTTKGTPQFSAMAYDQMWNKAAETMIKAISILADVAEVEVVSLCGNHDNVTAYSIFRAIDFYFMSHPRVTVDSEMSDRKYRVFGPTLVYFAHGDLPMKNIVSLCQREARREFGQTDHAEIHLGHLHHEIAGEKDGVTLRWVKSLVRTNTWHKRVGYTGSSHALMSFLWGEKGLEEMWFSR